MVYTPSMESPGGCNGETEKDSFHKDNTVQITKDCNGIGESDDDGSNDVTKCVLCHGVVISDPQLVNGTPECKCNANEVDRGRTSVLEDEVTLNSKNSLPESRDDNWNSDEMNIQNNNLISTASGEAMVDNQQDSECNKITKDTCTVLHNHGAMDNENTKSLSEDTKVGDESCGTKPIVNNSSDIGAKQTEPADLIKDSGQNKDEQQNSVAPPSGHVSDDHQVESPMTSSYHEQRMLSVIEEEGDEEGEHVERKDRSVPSTSDDDSHREPTADVSFEDMVNDYEDIDEDLYDLSMRIAQKASGTSSGIYRLVDMASYEEEIPHDPDFRPPGFEDIFRDPEPDPDEEKTEKEEEDPEDKDTTDPDKVEEDKDTTATESSEHDNSKDSLESGEVTNADCDAKDTAVVDTAAADSANVDTAAVDTADMDTAVVDIAKVDTATTRVAIPVSPNDLKASSPTSPKPSEIPPWEKQVKKSLNRDRVRRVEYRRSNSWKRSRSQQQAQSQSEDTQAYREDEEENFVLMALVRAVEEGNLDSLKQVLDEAENFNINQCNKQGETLLHTAASNGHPHIIEYLQEKGVDLNATDKHGDSAIYWAVRQGHLAVIKYLQEQSISLDTQNKAGEAPIHIAARFGHIDILEFLCHSGADANLQDKLGETALHTVAWHGLPPEICSLLCRVGCKVDTRNKENETPLHCAASRGNLECVRILLSHGASLNVQDKRQNTPLHLACRRRYVPIALLLLQAGCAFDILDCINETPLHPGAKEGLLPVVQTMCAYGCQVDLVNKGGLTALHLAARCGHTEVVRCLLLSGAEPEQPNKDGVSAEIMALAQGHQEVAELLAKLKPERREMCIKQLIPTSQQLSRIKVKVFGSSKVGKTTLINTLKCGYLSSIFRKARLNSSNSVNNTKNKATENGTIPRQQSLPTQLTYDIVHEFYTHGIDIQQVNISGAGDVSVWDFSGYEPYYVMYDHFIGDPNCVHLIVFSLEDSQDVQLSQILFWLNFLKSRIAPMEPIGPAGKLPWPARVLLVATHADKVECTKNVNTGDLENRDASILLATVRQKFESDLYIQEQLFVVDAHIAMSPELKALRNKLGDMKSQIVQFLPCSNGFLEATVGALSTWRKALSDYPIVTWPIFMDYVRSKVNLLASEEHLKELMCQLQLVGEVIYIETEADHDLVVLSPKWLCSDVIGHLLSHGQLIHTRPTGCFTIDDFQLMCPETDAKDLLVIMEALELCTRCEVDGEVEYEFPCLNFVEMIPGLWDKDDSRIVNPVYGGVRIHCPRGMNNQLLHMFPRIQTHLRRDILSEHSRLDADLYQWYHGSKFCSGTMECLILLSQSEQVVEVKCRGPEEMRTSLYYFQEDVCDIVLDVIEDSCPGICLEKYILSAAELKTHQQSVYAYTPKDILSAQMEGVTNVHLNPTTKEEFIDLIAFGSEEIWNNITPGIDLHAHYLSIHGRRRLSMLLDPPDPMGRDWCLLAVALGHSEDLPHVDQGDHQLVRSKTDTVIDMWSRGQECTIAALIRKLKELGRQDAADTLLTVSPLYHVFQDNQSQEDKANPQPTPYSSDNTLSSSTVSR